MFLMYAFLALGSSHLGRLIDSPSFNVHALTYRIQALDGLRRAMAEDSWNHGHADSLIAAGYTLMLQAAHMEDGLQDWMSLFRMVFSISRRVSESKDVSTEFDLRPTHHYEYITPYLPFIPSIDARLLSSGLQALEILSPELEDCTARSFCESLESTLKAHRESPQQGYLTFGRTFAFWLDLSEEDFAKKIEPSNGEMQLLLAYFISILLMMIPQAVIENHEGMEWHTPRHLDGMLAWISNCIQNVPSRLKHHCTFVEMVLASATAELNGLPFSGARVLQFDAARELHVKIKGMQRVERKALSGI